MSETTAIRTLVKSAPEVWAACSDAESLARHLGAFGDIRITRLEPETTVAWEGERASGTVTIEPSSWGTKVTMTATTAEAVDGRSVDEAEPVAQAEPVDEAERVAQAEPVAEAERVAEMEPVAAVQPVAPMSVTDGRRPGILARLAALFGRHPPEAAVRPEPEPEAEPEVEVVVAPEPERKPARDAETDPESALGAALDSLGQAHHRPFSQL